MRIPTTLGLAIFGVAMCSCGSHGAAVRAPQSAGRTSAPTPTTELPAMPTTFDLDAIDAYLSAQVEQGKFTGLSLAIMRHGEIVFAKGYGLRSIEDAAPVEPDTPFAIGSVTKELTCAAALLLQEDGKLDVNDKVARYYPNLTRAEDITLLDLLHHISGYRDYAPLDFMTPRFLEDVDTEKVVTEWASRPLDFEPRARLSYSNTGYLLVGRVIERVSGSPLRDVMKERIFDKLGMRHTQLKDGPPPANAAKGYFPFALGDPEPARREGAGWMQAAGGVWSTPTDLLVWDLALADGKLLAPSSYAIMTSPGVLSDGRTTDYGCGLAISRQHHETVLAHTGEVNGYLAFNAIVPRTRSGVVALTNDNSADLGAVGRGVTKLLLEEEDAAATRIPVAGPPPRDEALALFHQMQANQVDILR